MNILQMQSIILDYMSDSIFVHDMQGQFLYVNKEAYESRGYTYDELMAMSVKELDDPNEESVLKMKKNIEQMKANGFVTFEVNHQRKDKSLIPVEIRSQVFVFNDEKVVISVARDISERQKVHAQLRAMATTDALTSLYNRHKFELLFEIETQKQDLQKSEMSLLLLDIDYFKKINDNYGHDVGDVVLKEFSSLLSTQLRSNEIIARWGGEEFIVLLPNTELKQAMSIAMQMNKNVASYAFSHVKNLHVSIGVTSYKAGDSLTSFTKRADIALYNAKNLGRNRIESFY